jgi:glycosyltransferase involved in cell wall biosynthesis
MKILQIPDCPWSIGRLCEIIRAGNPDIEFRTLYVPPRDILEHLDELAELINWADIVNFEYWNVAWQICDFLPDELEKKKKILTYHTIPNKRLDAWDEMDAIIVKTNSYWEKINALYPGKVWKVENVPDTECFKWIDTYPPKTPAIGYVGRVVPWKGLKEVARVCYELGYPLYVMGAFDKTDYWKSIPDEYKSIINFDFWGCEDNRRLDFYKTISLYVGNSEPDHEAGTLPFLEALACGVPVVTTANGMAADIVEGEKDVLLFHYGAYEEMKNQIKRAMDSLALREKLRVSGRNAVAKYTPAWLAMRTRNVFDYVYNLKK